MRCLDIYQNSALIATEKNPPVLALDQHTDQNKFSKNYVKILSDNDQSNWIISMFTNSKLHNTLIPKKSIFWDYLNDKLVMSFLQFLQKILTEIRSDSVSKFWFIHKTKHITWNSYCFPYLSYQNDSSISTSFAHL